jgi:hypothetical protein
MATLHLPTSLQKFAKGQAVLTLPGRTVAEMLEACFVGAPQLRLKLLTDAGALQRYVRVFADGQALESLEAPLSATAEVRLLIALAGG